MKFNELGRTGIKVSEICLGTMTWGSQNTEAEAHAQIDHALEAGINFMDTAEVYAVPSNPGSYGLTEEYIGSWMRKTGQRDRWVLATKIAGPGRPWIRGGTGYTGETVREAVEGSLKRLRTDYIDLYQLHWPNRGHYHFQNSWTYDPSVQNTEESLASMRNVLESLGELVKEGKIRHIGLSNETAWGILSFLKMSEDADMPRVASVQNEFSLLRRIFEHDLAEVAQHEDVGLLAYSPLAAGVITGKYFGGALPEGTRGALAGSVYRNNEYSEPVVRRYLALAERFGLDVCQMALAFILTRPFLTAVIIGSTSMAQLKNNIGAKDLTLPAEVMAEIEAIHRRHPRPV